MSSGLFWGVPRLPPHYLPRADAMDAVEKLLLGSASRVGISATGEHRTRFGVHGSGGIGKTVLATALVRERQAIRARFVDGVVWLSLGQSPSIVTLQAQLARRFGHDGAFAGAHEGTADLRRLLDGRAVLLVLDDVWDIKHAGALDVVSEPGRLLITTRNRQILTGLDARDYALDVLSEPESRALLAEWAGCEPAALPPAAREIVELCGRLPLALSMGGAMVRDHMAWEHVKKLLRDADLDQIAQEFPDYPYPDMLRAIDVSVEALPAPVRERYLRLAVFAEDEPIPEDALCILWDAGPADAAATVRALANRSMVLREGEDAIVLHDLQRLYVRKRMRDRDGGLAALHNAFIEAFDKRCPHGFARGPALGRAYFFTRLPYQLIEAGRAEELRALLWSYPWLDAKLRAAGMVELLADFERLEPGPALALVRDALHLSSHVLARDPAQLPGQMIGRLGHFADEDAEIRALLDRIPEQAEHPWLCSTLPSLTPPGGPLLRTFEVHTRGVLAVAMSRDGTRCLSGSEDCTLRLWDSQTGQLVHVFAGHSAPVTAVVLSDDGGYALSGSFDRTLRLWDTRTGRLVCVFKAHSDSVWAVALSGDGTRALSGSHDRTLRLWDTQTGQLVRTFEAHSESVTAVALSADGARALSGSHDCTLKLWDTRTGRLMRTFNGHSDAVTAVALSGDGARALSGSHDRTLKLWDTRTGRFVHTLVGHSDTIMAVALSNDGARALSGSLDLTVKLWDTGEGRLMRTFEGHSRRVTAVALSSDGTRALSGSWDCTLKIWDTGAGRLARSFAGHSAPVTTVALSGDGARALSGSLDCALKLWDTRAGRLVHTFEGQSAPVTAVSLSGDGARALSGSVDRVFRLWDTRAGRLVHTFEGHSARVTAMALSNDGTRALSGSWDGTLKLWEAGTGRLVHTFEGHSDLVTAVGLSSDGARALSSSLDHTLKLWDTRTGRLACVFERQARTFEGHSNMVMTVALSDDGTRALSGSEDRTLRLWDCQTGQLVHVFAGHSAPVTAVALSGDGKRALSASSDRTLRLWDTGTGQPVATFAADQQILACALSWPANPLIVAGDRAGRVHFLRPVMPHSPRPAQPSTVPAAPPPEPKEDLMTHPPPAEPVTRPNRVFISYTHDSEAHARRVLDLAERLRSEGIDARLDQYEPHPAEGWPRWMQRQIDEADFILMICTATYCRRFDGHEQPDRGKGATFEGLIILQSLYDEAMRNRRLIPVLFDPEAETSIPAALRPYTRYRLPADYDALYRRLTDQPAVVLPPIGSVVPMPPRR